MTQRRLRPGVLSPCSLTFYTVTVRLKFPFVVMVIVSSIEHASSYSLQLQTDPPGEAETHRDSCLTLAKAYDQHHCVCCCNGSACYTTPCFNKILLMWPDALAYVPDKHILTMYCKDSHTHAQDSILLLTESAFFVGIDKDSF